MRRVLLLLLLICILGFNSVVEAKEITLVISVSGERAKFMDEYLAWYKEVNPDIKVTVISGSDDKVLTLLSAGVPPELYRIGFETYAEYAEQGAMADIGPLLARHNFDFSLFFDPLVQAIKYKGVYYGLPSNVNPEIVFWNKQLFSERGIAPPPVHYGNPNWTWQTLRDLSKKLTVDNDGDGTPEQWGAMVVKNFAAQSTFGSAWNAKWMDDWGNTFVGNSPQMVEALRFLADWINQDRTAFEQSGGDPFGSGKAAMLIGSAANRVPNYEAAGLPYGVAPSPTGHIPLLRGAVIRFIKGSDIEAAWDFAYNLVANPYWAARKAIAFGGVPSMRAAFAEYQKLATYVTQDMLTTFIDQVMYGEIYGPSYGPRFTDINNILNKYVSDVVKNVIPPGIAVEQAADEINGLLGRQW